MAAIRILLADDHTVLREGIAQVLNSQADMTVVAQAANGRDALAAARQHRPDIALLDINMPDFDGVAAARQIAAEQPELGIIILTMYRRDEYVFEAIKAGARGYLLKEVTLDELLAAIRAVAGGEAVIDPAMASRVLAELRRPPVAGAQDEPPAVEATAEDAAFRERDFEILRRLAQGKTNRQIAAALGISDKTVRNRLSFIFRQLHLSNRTQAALYAIRQGLVEDPAAAPDRYRDPAVGDPGVGDPAVGDPAVGDPAVGDPAVGDPAVGDDGS